MIAAQEIKLPFGKTADGRMVSVEAVARGSACECFCPTCSARLIAAKGTIYRHHFRHANDNGGAYCAEARETALHLFAKQVICDELFLALPDMVGKMVKATPECRLGDIVPDVLAEYDSGETVAIEIWVAHQVPDHKAKAYNDRRQAAVEIDLRSYRLDDRSEADWRRAVLLEAARHWLSPPKHVRAKREAAARRLRRLTKIALAGPRLELLRLIERQRIRVAKMVTGDTADMPQRPAQPGTPAQWREYWLALATYQDRRRGPERERMISKEQRLLEIAELRFQNREYRAVAWLKAEMIHRRRNWPKWTS